MTQLEVFTIASRISSDSILEAQLRQGWSRTPNAVSPQSAGNLELLANDCCQCNTHSGSTKSGV